MTHFKHVKIVQGSNLEAWKIFKYLKLHVVKTCGWTLCGKDNFKILQSSNLEAWKISKCIKLHIAQLMWYRQF